MESGQAGSRWQSQRCAPLCLYCFRPPTGKNEPTRARPSMFVSMSLNDSSLSLLAVGARQLSLHPSPTARSGDALSTAPQDCQHDELLSAARAGASGNRRDRPMCLPTYLTSHWWSPPPPQSGRAP